MNNELFPKKRAISKVAQNILKKRYFSANESSWDDIVNRVVNWVIPHFNEKDKELTRQMIANTYFIPNSPCLVNSGKPNGGLAACFVVESVWAASRPATNTTVVSYGLSAGGLCREGLRHGVVLL